jgi:hypothetical protein
MPDILLIWLKFACGNFSGHYFVARGQKAWFLPTALCDGACGALAASFSGHYTLSPAGKKRGFCPLRCVMAPAARWRQVSADITPCRRRAKKGDFAFCVV